MFLLLALSREIFAGYTDFSGIIQQAVVSGERFGQKKVSWKQGFSNNLNIDETVSNLNL